MMQHRYLTLVPVVLLALAGAAQAQGGTLTPSDPPAAEPDVPAAPAGEEGKGGLWDKLKKSGGDALSKAGEKVGDQVKGLSESVSENLTALTELKKEVAELRLEVSALRDGQQELRDQIEDIETTGKPLDLGSETAPEVIRVRDLGEMYIDDPAAAQESYSRRYIKVIGPVLDFVGSAGAGEVIVLLGAPKDGHRVRAYFTKDADFPVALDPDGGRLVNKADGTTFLTIGQPVVVSGTCVGKTLDIEMRNCRIENLTAKPLPVKVEEKR